MVKIYLLYNNLLGERSVVIQKTINMKSKTKIAIYGIGGVGGYYGGKLAKEYEKSENVEIYFIARGKNLTQINKQGLKVIEGKKEFIAYPKSATDNPQSIGTMDYILIATKSYDLKTAIENLKPCIEEQTVILPLLNGGNITEIIRDIVPKSEVWSGYTYIVSRKTSSGVVENFGSNSIVVFGYDKGNYKRVYEFENIMRKADIDIKVSEEVRNSIWKKFLFISVTASLTSFFDCTFTELIVKDKIEFTQNFGIEFLSVAKAEKIYIGEEPIKLLIQNTRKLPKGTTSSMHSDFQAKHISEVEALTGLIVILAKKHNLPVPLYNKVYRELQKREKENQMV